jgi:putative transposase
MTTLYYPPIATLTSDNKGYNRSSHVNFLICYGPEYVSELLAAWAQTRGIGLQFIQPGKPQQNAYVERYNRTVRYDWLNQYILETIEDAQQAATEWLWTYNNERSNMAIGSIAPKQKFAMGVLMAA